MIKTQDCTPNVYYNQSRDFQFIGRLYDLVLNSLKTNSELVYNIPLSDNVDSSLVELLALTLGFKSQHSYTVRQLLTLCKIFTKVLKNKGNIESIKLAGNALVSAEGLNKDFNCRVQDGILYLYIPAELTNFSILKDLLTYILPAGMPCNIIKTTATDTGISTQFISTDKVTITSDFIENGQNFIYKPSEADPTKDNTNKDLFINRSLPKKYLKEKETK